MTLAVFVFSWVIAQPPGASPDPAPDQLLREAKLALLDRDWEATRGHCERLLERYPRSPLAAQARFYLARALERAGDERQALSAYQRFLHAHQDEDELSQDARTAAIGLARRLVEEGEDEYWPLLREGLSDRSRAVRAYAALEMSHLGDVRRAREAVPVLAELVRGDAIPDLQDRARIALLRLDPRTLVQVETGGEQVEVRLRTRMKPARGRWLKLHIYHGRGREAEVRLVVPVALGELVYRALSEDLKRELRRKKGIDLDNFWRELEKLGTGKILSIETREERFELWIE